MSIVGFAGEIFLEDKVVAHFKDGRIVKGHTRDFSPSRDSFTLTPYTDPVGPVPVFLEELKAVFHVKTFEGNTEHDPPAREVGTIENQRFSKVMDAGRKVALHFNDGERLWGWATSVDEGGQGFFFFPTDPTDNNLRLYVIRSSLREMVILDN